MVAHVQKYSADARKAEAEVARMRSRVKPLLDMLARAGFVLATPVRAAAPVVAPVKQVAGWIGEKAGRRRGRPKGSKGGRAMTAAEFEWRYQQLCDMRRRITQDQAADLLGLHKQTFIRYLHEGKLPWPLPWAPSDE